MSDRRTVLQSLLSCLGLAVVCAALGHGAQAQSVAWPGKAIKIIVPYPSGGVTDAAARLLAERLATGLGSAVVVENKAGAGGLLGMDAVAKSADGHTLALAAVSPLTLLPHLMNVPFEAARDFSPIGTVMYSPVYVLATPAFAGKRLEDVISYAVAHPGKLSMATSGVGSVGHIMLEQIKRKASVDIAHIPYKGGGSQVIADAAGGHFDLFTSNPSPNLSALMAQGKLRVLAVTGPTRLASLPEIPTLGELGYPLANLTSLFGLLGPARLPQEHVVRLNVELNKVLAQKDVQERLTKLDNVVTTSTPARFQAILQSESAANARIVKDAGIKLE